MREIWVQSWLLGPRFFVRRFLARVPKSLDGELIILRCDDVLYSTESAAGEVVRQILVKRGAEEMLIVGGGSKFALDLIDAAEDHGVGLRVGRIIDPTTLPRRLPGILALHNLPAARH